MTFEPTSILGAFALHLERHEDDRGHFARVWCREEFAAKGLDLEMVQASVSYNRRAGTLRGLHYSLAPAREGKLVRCEAGRVFDVLVDLRPESASYLEHFCIELDATRGNAVYAPPGVAHGFQTLADESRVVYMMSDFYRPELAAGVRHDDPAFAIRWPLPISVIAPRDLGYADFAPVRAVGQAHPRAD